MAGYTITPYEQCKVFTCEDGRPGTLEEKINSFLMENEDIYIISRHVTPTLVEDEGLRKNFITVTLFYRRRIPVGVSPVTRDTKVGPNRS